ncbi:MAG: hypothetical protein AB8G17_02400 [Gammaproteobacteria bacterium]
MSQEDPFRLYVSHLWAEDDDYLRLFEYINDVENFFYVNLSDPADQPRSMEFELVVAQYRRQMEKAEVAIMLSTQYVTNANMTQYQLNLARELSVPVVVIEPYGPDSVLKPVKDRAAEVVPWYNRSIVDAIRHHGRGDLTSRYEVIDFP